MDRELQVWEDAVRRALINYEGSGPSPMVAAMVYLRAVGIGNDAVVLAPHYPEDVLGPVRLLAFDEVRVVELHLAFDAEGRGRTTRVEGTVFSRSAVARIDVLSGSTVESVYGYHSSDHGPDGFAPLPILGVVIEGRADPLVLGSDRGYPWPMRRDEVAGAVRTALGLIGS